MNFGWHRILLILCMLFLGMYGMIRSVIMHPDMTPYIFSGACFALVILLLGFVAGIFVGIKLEDSYDIDSGVNYRRSRGSKIK